MKNVILTITFLCVVNLSNLYAQDFPLREKYPNVKTISSEQLYDNYKSYLLIDVRSRYEFLAIRMRSARSVPLGNEEFVASVQKLQHSRSDKPVVFYCNGITCAKSYKAYNVAKDSGIENVMVYDAGILNWARKYPQQTTLLGETPANLKFFLTDDKFKSHLIPTSEFKEKMAQGAIVIDVRDGFQRIEKIFEDETINVPIDEAVLYASRKSKEGKTLLLYDAVGKQVRWLQFYLEKAGVTDYYFLEGGVKGYLGK